MAKRASWRSMLQHAQTIHWVWQLGVPAFVAAVVGGIVSVWAEFETGWQILSALSAFFLTLGFVDVVAAVIKKRRIKGYSPGEFAEAIDQLAQGMIEVLADARRNAPPPAVANYEGESTHDEYEAWSQGVIEHTRHENNTVARFTERFSVELAGVISELQLRNIVSSADAQKVYWNLQSSHWISGIPMKLAEWAAVLRQSVPDNPKPQTGKDE